MKQTTSIKTKFIVMFVAIIVAIGFILFVSSYRDVEAFVRQSQSFAENALSKISVHMELQLNNLRTTSTIVAEDELIRSYLENGKSEPERLQLERRLTRFISQYNSIPLNIYIIGKNGSFLTNDKGYRPDIEQGIAEMKRSVWFQQQRDSYTHDLRFAGVFPAYFEKTGTGYHCIFAMNIYDISGEWLGLSVLDIDSYIFDRQLETIVNYGDIAFLVNHDKGVAGNSMGRPDLYNTSLDDESNIIWVALKEEMSLAYAVSKSVISDFEANTVRSALLIVIILASVGFTFYFFIKRSFLLPVIELSNSMKAFSETIERTELPVKSKDEIGVLTECFNQMSEKIVNAVDRIRENERELSSLEFRMLQAQINPHFLYNTLNSLKVMADVMECGNLAKAISCLSGLLRYSVERRDNYVTIGEEIKYIKDYVYLNNIRFNDKFELFVEADKALEKEKVLKFLIQPFVENSIMHGYKSRKGTGRIDFKISVDEDDKNMLFLQVRDYGSGFSLTRLESKKKNLYGIGITNVEDRLKLLYGGEYRLSIDSKNQKGTFITLCIPRVPEEEKVRNDNPDT